MRIKKRIRILELLLIIAFLTAGLHSAGAQESKFRPDENNSISLKDCVKFAVDNSFEVKLARLDFLIAETDLGKAEAVFDSTLFANLGYADDKRQPLSVFSPTHTQTNTYSAGVSKKIPSGTELSFSFSDTRTWNNSQYVSENPAYTAEAALEARQPLARNFLGQIDRQDVSVAKMVIQNADLTTKGRIESLVADVEGAYWEWVFSKESLKIYRNILKKAQRLLKINLKNYDMGRIERGDLLAVQANVLIRKKDVSLADNRYRRAEGKIKLLMNMDADFRIHPRETLKYREVEFNLADSLKTAFQKRRDYQRAKRELEIKDIVFKVKANERWPEIDLVASLAANGIKSGFSEAADKMFSDGNAYYYAGVEVSIPLENKRARSEFKKAKHNKEKAIINIKSIERTIVTEITDAFRNYVTYHANLNNLMEASKLQQEKLKEEEKRFNYGRSNTKRLIDYQQDDLRAQLEVSLGMLAYELSRVNLEKALNIILKEYEDRL